jgi:nucleotide-binding universal stress UspA family protein
MYGRILLAVDGSDQNKNAVRDAVGLASKLGSKITAVYVMVGTELRPNAFGGDVGLSERQEIADKGAKEAFDLVESLALAEGVECEVKALPGKPCEVLTGMSDQYDLLICGSVGRTGLTKLMGSVSKELVKCAKCPVLVIR